MILLDNTRDRPSAAAHFVVALDGPDGKSFAICEQIMTIDPEAGALPAGSFERLVRGGRLMAAELPDDGSAWLRAASFAQSADDQDAEEEE